MTLRKRKLAVFVTCLGLAAAFPVLSSADRGGHPHNNKPCPVKGNSAFGRGHHKFKPKNDHGKKCGFVTTTTENGTTNGSTSTETETETDQTTTVNN